MSPRTLVFSTTYKTRVALEKAGKKREGIVIGQLQDSEHCRAAEQGLPAIAPFTITASSRWRGKVEIGFGRRAYRIEPSADEYLGVGFTAEVPGSVGFRRF